MPREKKIKLLSEDNLRHAEYYDMQKVFDDLYSRSKQNEIFTDLMEAILSRENILLAYRNIKTNTGSNTAGTDKLTIKDIKRLSPDAVVNKVRFIVTGSTHGYRPKPVRRKEIPKPHDPTKTRPLGIPCIWDRLVQQCIKQIMEPICEAKFSDNSYGFRPNRCVEHAIAETHRLIQRSHLHYVIEFDIKGFFDNVDHSKLIKQIWSMGIRDTQLIYVLKSILKAPIKMPDGSMTYPQKGTPQGGIISPLLANIVLNELDHWIDGQWQSNPVTRNYSIRLNNVGKEILSHGYRAMRTTKLKEMCIIRYADDFRIFCRTKTEAEKAKIAITQWLYERLRLEISPEKTKIVNVKRRYSDFLGFKIKVHPKGNKHVVQSHISDKQLSSKKTALLEQAKHVAHPRPGKNEYEEILLYNSMVMGMQNYYQIATCISADFSTLSRAVLTVFQNRLHTQTKPRLVKQGRELTKVEQERYGSSAMLRYVAGTREPIYPIGYVQHKPPHSKKRSICSYTTEGRVGLHDNLRVNVPLMIKLMQQPLNGRSIEYADNRISLFSAQWGKCAVTGKDFKTTEDIHCHHIKPKKMGGNDNYGNLTLVLDLVHKLIHATNNEVITRYMTVLALDNRQLAKLNKFRQSAGLFEIV